MRLWLILIVLALSSPLWATDRYASVAGGGSAPCTTPGSPCTLATAITASVGGDNVNLRAGTYSFPSGIVKAGSQIVVQADAGNGGTQANVIISSASFGNMDFVKFNNVTIGSGCGHHSGYSTLGSGANNDTFYNVHWACGLQIVVSSSATMNITIDGDPGNMDASSPVFKSNFTNLPPTADDGRLEITGGGSTTLSSGIVVRNTLFNGSAAGGDCSDGVNIDYGVRGIVIGPGNLFMNILESDCSSIGGTTVHDDAIQSYPGNPLSAVPSFLTIQGNFFYNTEDALMGSDCPRPNNTFTDNVFVMHSGGATQFLYLGGSLNDNINHNTFFSLNGAGPYFTIGNIPPCPNVTPSNATVTNNVMNDIAGSPSSSTFDYNLSTASATVRGTHGVNSTPTYVGGASPTTYAGFALTAGSAGHHAASDGLDMGARIAAPVSCGNTDNWTNSACQTISGGQQLTTAFVNGVASTNAWTVISRHGEYSQAENECNVPGALSISGGMLSITTTNAALTCGNWRYNGSSWITDTTPSSFPYTTGDMQWNSFNFTFGTVIVRMKPLNSNTGLWPAIWFLGSNCQETNKYTGETPATGSVVNCPQINNAGYREIDMLEFMGSSGNWPSSNVWNPSGNQKIYPQSPINDGLFHKFMMDWRSGSSLTFTVDGNAGTSYNSGVPTSALFMLMQTQTCGTNLTTCPFGPPVNGNLPASMVIDYVKVCNVSLTAAQCDAAATNDANVIFFDDFVAGAPTTHAISGALGANAANATVTWPEGGGGTVSADASGNYTILGLADGTYTVTPQKTGFTFTPTNRSVTVSGADVSGVNFTAALAAIYSISGTVTFNAGSTDPDPVTISLTGTSTGSTTTDGSGNYTLSGLTNGTYTVTPSKATYTFAPTNLSGIVILGANQTGKNFVATGTAAVTFTPSSWDFGSQGIGIPSAGKVIQLSNTGTAQLTSIVVSDSGTNAGNFSETTSPTPNCGGTLNAGANCDITVIFTPSALGVRNANLSVTDNLGTQTAALTGQGYQAPVPSCTPMGGTYKTARLVNCTNAVPIATMCWKIGSPPATNGAGICTVGAGTAIYTTGGILMTGNGPLYVTGTQAGNIDNTVGYAFTVSPSWTSGWVMQRNETGVTHMGTGGGVVIFAAYTGAAIVQPPATPDVGNLLKNNAIVQDTSYPSGTQARIGRCTDQAFTPTLGLGNHSKAAGLGGSADAMQLFNTNSTMLQIEDTGGSNFLTLFDKATMTCGGAITDGAHNITNGGSATNAHNFSSGSFSWTDPTVWYTFGQGPDTTPTQAIKYTFNTSTGDFTTGPLIADLQYGLPLNLTAWQQTHAYTAGAYVSYTLSGTEAPDWASGHAYVLGDIIKPLTNNASGCAFKVTTAGTSNSTPPGSWGATCGVLTVSDGATVKWRGIGGPPIFTYQLTSAGGTSGGSTPAFVPGDGHPQLMTTVTDGALTWTNTGPMVIPAWQSFAGISRDSTRICSAFNSNSYMYNAIPRNGIQGEGIYAACYDATANKYHLLNTATGWQSTSTCSGGSGYNCAGGAWTLAPDGKLTGWPQAGDCGMRIHNMKGSSKMDYPIVASQAPVATGISPCVTEVGATTSSVVWAPFATFSAANSGKPETQGLNHWAMGATHVLNVGQSLAASGFGTGAYTMYTDLTNPTAQSPITWQPTCAVSWSAGNPLPPCTFAAAYDSHMGWAYNPGDLDTSPICGTMYSLTNLNPIPDAPWQSEEVCVPTSPQWTDGNKPGNATNPWRFTHSFSTGTNQSFSSQFSISEMSQDGKYLAFGSDWMCTLGSTDGTSNSFCGLQWKPSTAYTIGTMLNPYSSNGGSGTDFGVWQVNTNGTSSPSTKPPWVPCPGAGNVNLGTTITDTLATPIPMVFTCLGAGNGRGDVFVVELAP